MLRLKTWTSSQTCLHVFVLLQIINALIKCIKPKTIKILLVVVVRSGTGQARQNKKICSLPSETRTDLW